MSTNQNSEPAFPVIPPDSDCYKGWPAHIGLTRLEYIATAALQGIIKGDGAAPTLRHVAEDVTLAVTYAEALLAELKARESGNQTR